MIRRLVLVGLSGTGKSTTSVLAGAQLGWSVIDLDAEIEHETGRTIPDIFRHDGEAVFRGIESTVFHRALERDEVVVATGGGAVLDPAIWDVSALGDPETLVVWLDADVDVLVDRLIAQAATDADKASRPLLEGNPAERFRVMREARRPHYDKAQVALDVTHRSAEDVATDLRELVLLGNGVPSVIDLKGEGFQSRIQVGSGVSSQLATVIAERWPKAQRVWAIVDANAAPHLQPVLEHLAAESHLPVQQVLVASGESSKSIEGLSRLYDTMLEGGLERGDVVLAVGGGVVGDLAGFAAATVLRGVGLVQVPTTLLSMVDSSVGGKTGINHAAGKNLIGAFYQPAEVLIDPNLLASLPARELKSGWGEIIKHGVIEPSTPPETSPVILDALRRNVSSLTHNSSPLLPWVIRRNISLKASVVQADEREAGLRAILNFGHTIGHGVEAAGYSLLHGEAVAVGMNAALSIGEAKGSIDLEQGNAVRELIDAFGLPQTATVDADLVRLKMASDKKKTAGKQKWLLPVREGGVEVRTDVSDAEIDQAIARVTQ